MNRPATQVPPPEPVATFRDVFEREFGYVTRTLRLLGVPNRDLEDVAHDVFLHVSRHFTDYDGARPLRPWLYGFAVRIARDFRKRASNRQIIVHELGALPDPGPAPDVVLFRTQLFYTTYDSALLKCDLSDCQSTLARIDLFAPSGDAALFSTTNIGAHLLALDEQYVYLAVDQLRIVRVLREGVSTFEVVARPQSAVGEMLVHGDALYWSEPRILGGIYSCPKSGCSGASTLVAGGLHNPYRLAADDQNLYFTEPPDYSWGQGSVPAAGSDRISRCALTGCQSPTLLLENVNASGGLAVDDHFIYFSGSAYYDPFAPRPQALAFLAVVPK